MNNKSNADYQYNRCTSKGLCSINPTTSALQEVITLYLKQASYYALKLETLNCNDKTIRNLVLNTISILNSNYEISIENFNLINSAFQKELPRIIDEYKKLCSINNLTPELLSDEHDFNNNLNINEYIRLGEKEFIKRNNNLSVKTRNLYKIIITLIKSMCINVLTLESYEENMDYSINSILRALNTLNYSQTNIKELKKVIIDISGQDCELLKKIRSTQEKLYGEQSVENISFSTKRGKAVLVVGSNLRELEQILDKFEHADIDIYTHDNMILAHTFPKFKNYKNLKGQYGQGIENCLLDFSTFPGPIILTRNSLFNVENLYRGMLYTTDFAYSKGIIKIKNDDFSEVIQSAQNAKGFKTGKTCAAEEMGFSYTSACNIVHKQINNNNYNKIFVIGIGGYSLNEKEYFKTLIKHVSKETCVISFSCCNNNDNILCFNTGQDNTAFLKLSEFIINNTKKEISFFIPYVDRHTLSILIYLNHYTNHKTFIGTWSQNYLTPDIIDGLKQHFAVNEISSPKQDLSKIYNDK